MNEKQLIKKLEKVFNDNEFVMWNNKTDIGQHLDENEFVLCGKDHTETFIIRVMKI